MSSLRSGTLPAAFAAILLTLSATQAHALPTAQDKEDAKSAVAEARIAIGLNRFDDAVKALRRADQLDPNPQTKVDLADALTSAGKLIEASQILNLVVDSNPPAPKKLKESAKTMLESLEQRIPWIQVKIIGPEQNLTSTTIDGKEIDAENEIPFNPGTHVIGADADGYKPVEKKVKLKEGAHLKVKLEMERADGSGKKKKKVDPDEESEGDEEENGDEGEDSAPPPPKKKSSGGSVTDQPLFLPGVITGGAGVIGLTIGTAFGAMALSTTDDLKKRCKGGTTCAKTAANERLQEDALSQGNVSTAMFIIGGLATAAGGVMLTLAFIADPPKKSKEKAFVVPYVGLGEAGVVGTF